MGSARPDLSSNQAERRRGARSRTARNDQLGRRQARSGRRGPGRRGRSSRRRGAQAGGGRRRVGVGARVRAARGTLSLCSLGLTGEKRNYARAGFLRGWPRGGSFRVI